MLNRACLVQNSSPQQVFTCKPVYVPAEVNSVRTQGCRFLTWFTVIMLELSFFCYIVLNLTFDRIL